MKKYSCLFSLLILLSAKSLLASTSISTAIVSGHWTLAGSPYNIYNDISVPNGQTLIIDPGVNVDFQGQFSFKIYGSLSAIGTGSQPIVFTVADTTGFLADTITTAGGWHGIRFFDYSGIGADVSSLKHCSISYTKLDTGAYFAGCGGLIVERPLAIENCEIFQNRGIGVSTIITCYTSTTGDLHISDCNFHDNSIVNGHVLFVETAPATHAYLTNNKFSGNTGFNIISAGDVNLDFINNEVYNNTTYDASISIKTGAMINNVLLRGNRIHHNHSDRCAALVCFGGNYKIDANLFANNQHTLAGPCGEVFGGGAMFLLTDSFHFYNTYYNVTNNLIANNFSADFGAGIEVLQANASITNNDIVNNQGNSNSGIYIFNSFGPYGYHSAVEIKNNLFLNNTNGGSGYYDSSNVTIFELDTLRYDHNWSEHPFYKDVYSTATTSIFCPSDTTTNIIGSTPGFVSPTLTNSVTESALPPANFSLLASSPCINMGDISGITPDSLDYARNARIYGSYIDIGACEYSPVAGALYTSAGPIAENNLITYPNPASGTLYVFTSEAKGAISLQDVSGKTILEQRVFAPQTPINIQPLPAGTYFVVWHHGNGGNTIQKVIKE